MHQPWHLFGVWRGAGYGASATAVGGGLWAAITDASSLPGLLIGLSGVLGVICTNGLGYLRVAAERRKNDQAAEAERERRHAEMRARDQELALQRERIAMEQRTRLEIAELEMREKRHKLVERVNADTLRIQSLEEFANWSKKSAAVHDRYEADVQAWTKLVKEVGVEKAPPPPTKGYLPIAPALDDEGSNEFAVESDSGLKWVKKLATRGDESNTQIRP